RGPVSRVPVSGRDPGREQRLFAQGRVERATQGARRAAGRRVRVHEADQGQDGRGADTAVVPAAEREPGLLRRREEAQRDPADADARAEARGARRDRLGPRRGRAQDRRRGREQPAPSGSLDDPRHALRALARADHPGLRARARRRPDREDRRPNARTRARRARLRLGAGGGRRTVTALERIFEATLSQGGTAADAARRAAFERFRASGGWPTTRAESWRYTDLRALREAEAELTFAPPPPSPTVLERVRALLGEAGLCGAGEPCAV